MKKCMGCANYTLRDKCPNCGKKAVSPNPAKFSPGDKYGKYRRMLREMNE